MDCIVELATSKGHNFRNRGTRIYATQPLTKIFKWRLLYPFTRVLSPTFSNEDFFLLQFMDTSVETRLFENICNVLQTPLICYIQVFDICK